MIPIGPSDSGEGLIVGPNGCLPEPQGCHFKEEEMTDPETEFNDDYNLDVDAWVKKNVDDWVQRKVAEIDEYVKKVLG